MIKLRITKEKRKFIRAFLVLVLPSLVAVVVVLGLMRWRVPTRIQLKLAVNRVVFTVGGTEATQILGRTVAFQAMLVEEFSRITFSQSKIVKLAGSAEDNHAQENNSQQPTFSLDLTSLNILGNTNPKRKSSVTFEVPESKSKDSGHLEPFKVKPDSEILLELRGHQITNITINIKKQQTIAALRIEDLFQVQTDFCEIDELPEFSSGEGSNNYQIKLSDSDPQIEITGQSDSLSLILTIPSEEDTSGIFHLNIPVKTLNFKPYPVQYIEIGYPEYSDIGKQFFDSPKSISLQNLGEFKITSITLNPDYQAIDLLLEGIAGEVKTASLGGFSKDLRLTVFDILWQNPAVIVLLVLFVWGVSMMAGIYELYRENIVPLQTNYTKLQLQINELQQKDEQKTYISWLHLTDLHRGMKEQLWLWPGVKEIFFKDLEKLHKKCGPWDLILFSGDLTQSGSPEEFQKVNEFFDQLWAYLKELGSSPKFLAVPGNHDLVRPTEEEKRKPSVKLFLQWENQTDIHTEFWEDAESPYRRIVEKVFENYTTWWNGQSRKLEDIEFGLLPGDFSATIEKNGVRLGVIGLNTSFLQLTGDDYAGKLALHAGQFHKVCGGSGPTWVKQHHACLLLTHHPSAWLNRYSQDHLYGEIIAHGYFAAHLCGHMHETVYREIAEGGTEARRIWQGRSLFGLEHFGKEDENQRLHGYTAGKIEFSENSGTLLFWPREARLQGGQRSIVPDYSLALIDNNPHTHPREFDLLLNVD